MPINAKRCLFGLCQIAPIIFNFHIAHGRRNDDFYINSNACIVANTAFFCKTCCICYTCCAFFMAKCGRKGVRSFILLYKHLKRSIIGFFIVFVLYDNYKRYLLYSKRFLLDKVLSKIRLNQLKLINLKF